jgi:excinuclease ABC subunit C
MLQRIRDEAHRFANSFHRELRDKRMVTSALDGIPAVAERVLKNLGLDLEIPVASLAKRFEEVFIPGQSEPVEVPRGSEALFMLQRIRDEAHRFANSFHRELRDKRMVTSALDGIPGLGEARKKRIIKAFGGVNAVKKASLDDLQGQTWLPEEVAMAIFNKFHQS